MASKCSLATATWPEDDQTFHQWETPHQTLGNCQNVLEVNFVTHFQLLVVSCTDLLFPGKIEGTFSQIL